MSAWKKNALLISGRFWLSVPRTVLLNIIPFSSQKLESCRKLSYLFIWWKYVYIWLEISSPIRKKLTFATSCQFTKLSFSFCKLYSALASGLSPAVWHTVQVSCFLKELAPACCHLSAIWVLPSDFLSWPLFLDRDLKFWKLSVRPRKLGFIGYSLRQAGLGRWPSGLYWSWNQKGKHGDLSSQTLEKVENSEKAALGSQLGP